MLETALSSPRQTVTRRVGYIETPPRKPRYLLTQPDWLAAIRGRFATRYGKVVDGDNDTVVESGMPWTAERIRALRHALDDSRARFAERVLVSDRTVEAWEQGWRQPSRLVQRELDVLARRVRADRIRRMGEP